MARGAARAWRTEEVTSYESGFKRELEAFHDWIVTGAGRPPRAGTACATSRCARPSSTVTTVVRRGRPRWEDGLMSEDSRAAQYGSGATAGASGAPIAVANAPVSYGAFELTVGQDPNVPTGRRSWTRWPRPATPASTSAPSATSATANGSASCWPSAVSAWPARTWNCRIPTRARSRTPWANSTPSSTYSTRCGPTWPGPRPGRRSPTRAVSGGRCSRPGPFGIILWL